jgi:hypothetical protein
MEDEQRMKAAEDILVSFEKAAPWMEDKEQPVEAAEDILASFEKESEIARAEAAALERTCSGVSAPQEGEARRQRGGEVMNNTSDRETPTQPQLTISKSFMSAWVDENIACGSPQQQPREPPQSPPKGPKQPEVAANKWTVELGGAVTIQGLQVAHRLNGCVGTCEQWDQSQKRWLVALQSGEAVLVKPENLLDAPSASSDVGVKCQAGFALYLAKLVS